MKRREITATIITAQLFALELPPQNFGVGFFSPVELMGAMGMLLVELWWGMVIVLYTVIKGTPVPTVDIMPVTVMFPFADERITSLTVVDGESEVLMSETLCSIRLPVSETCVDVVSELLDVGMISVVMVIVVPLQVVDAEGPCF
jgi:hypothetical protein